MMGITSNHTMRLRVMLPLAILILMLTVAVSVAPLNIRPAANNPRSDPGGTREQQSSG